MTICDSAPHLSMAALQRGARLLAKASICLRPCKEYPLSTTLALVPMLVRLVCAKTNSAGESYIYKQLPWQWAPWEEGETLLCICRLNRHTPNIAQHQLLLPLVCQCFIKYCLSSNVCGKEYLTMHAKATYWANFIRFYFFSSIEISVYINICCRRITGI